MIECYRFRTVQKNKYLLEKRTSSAGTRSRASSTGRRTLSCHQVIIGRVVTQIGSRGTIGYSSRGVNLVFEIQTLHFAHSLASYADLAIPSRHIARSSRQLD